MCWRLIARLKETRRERRSPNSNDGAGNATANACLEDKDNVPLNELSSSEGCLTDYFTRKLAEVVAAKGDPKKVFGRHQLSPSPDADAVDLCVAQIHIGQCM